MSSCRYVAICILLLCMTSACDRTPVPPDIETCLKGRTAAIEKLTEEDGKKLFSAQAELATCKKEAQEASSKCSAVKEALDQGNKDKSIQIARISSECKAGFVSREVFAALEGELERTKKEATSLFAAYVTFLSESSEGSRELSESLREFLGLDEKGVERTAAEQLEFQQSYMKAPTMNLNDTHWVVSALLSPIGRDGKGIEAFFDRHKDLLYSVMDADAYQKSNFRILVRALLNTYKRESTLWTAANGLGVSDMWKEDGTIDLEKLEKICRLSRYEGILENMKDSDVNFVIRYTKEVEGIEDWACSFWLLRDKEKNADSVIRVLREIDDHYGKGVSAGSP